jgi:mannosyltransferase
MGLGAVVLLAAAIRVWIATESLWLDELHTAWVAMGPLGDVVARAAAGNQPPLFYWIEWVVVRSVGANELGVRLISLIAGSLLPAAIYVLGLRWTRSPWVALLAALVAALDPQSIRSGTEARPYALIELLAVGHVGVVHALADRASRPLRLAFVAGAVLLFNLHYLTVLLIATEVVWLAFTLFWRRAEQRPGRYSARAFVVDLSTLAVVCALALPHLRAIYSRRDNWHLFIELLPPWDIVTIAPWQGASLTLLIGALVAGWFGAAASTSDDGRVSVGAIALTVAWLVVPATLAWIVSAADIARVFFPRYLRPSAPAAFLLLAIALSLVPNRRVRTGVAALIAIVAIHKSHLLSSNPRGQLGRNEDWRARIAKFEEQYRSYPYPVVFKSNLVECTNVHESRDPLLHDYCLFPITSLYPLEIDRRHLVPYGRTDPNLDRIAALRGGAWIVERSGPMNMELRIPRDSTPRRASGR